MESMAFGDGRENISKCTEARLLGWWLLRLLACCLGVVVLQPHVG